MSTLQTREQTSAPGIGSAGEVVVSNSGTRNVHVASEVVPDLSGILQQLGILNRHATEQTSRAIAKGITTSGHLQVGLTLGDFTVESLLPIDKDHFWYVIGRNAHERQAHPALITAQHDMISQIATNPSYQPQSGKKLVEFVRISNNISDLQIIQITPDNFNAFAPSIGELYGETFTSYPYDVTSAVGESCGSNVFVAAVDGNNRVLAITGAEMMNVAGFSIAEIGDSACRSNNAVGLGALCKRALVELMITQGRMPDIAFTDSRISKRGGVLKANQRAGLNLHPDIILPFHTAISADTRDQGDILQMNIPGGTMALENMTMCSLTAAEASELLDTYGGVLEYFNQRVTYAEC